MSPFILQCSAGGGRSLPVLEKVKPETQVEIKMKKISSLLSLNLNLPQPLQFAKGA